MQAHELASHLDKLLNTEAFKDSTWNGLQIEGNPSIQKVGFSVDSSLEAFQEAGSKGIDFLIVHHGLIWGGLKRITSMDKVRLQKLFEYGINLYAAHLPLDAHPELGNNASLASLLGLTITNSIGEVGVIGDWAAVKSFDHILALVREHISHDIQYLQYSQEPIRNIAICSGEISLDFLYEAARKGVNTILSGEGKGQSLFIHPARELAMNVIFAGHYETEVFGLKALMEKLKQNFGEALEFEWIGHGSDYQKIP